MERPFRLLTPARLGVVALVSLMAIVPMAWADVPTSLEEAIDEPVDQVLFEADTLTYDAEAGLVTAEGNVEANYGGRILIADRVTYNDRTDEVFAEGDVAISQPSGEVLFADRILLRNDLSEGIIESMRLLLANNAQLAATRATRTGNNITELEEAAFTACEECEWAGAPLWQIRSFRVTHDQQRQRIIYRDATFEILGVPVAYLPYFTHTDPTVERQSGVLPPALGNTTELGNWIEVPYYFALAPNYDLTVTPKLTSSEGLILSAEWRHRTRNGGYELEGSITNPNRRDDDNNELSGNRIRGHLFGDGQFDLANNWEWGFGLELVTDDTYLKRYDITNDDRLVNNLFARRFDGRNLTTLDSYYFIGLREEDDAGLTPIIPLLADHRQILDQRYFGGQVGLNFNALVLQRTDGTDTTRLSGELNWTRSEISDLGQVFTFHASARGDIYHVDNEPLAMGDPDDEQFVFRALPLAAFEWRWPFVRQNGSVRQVIEPIVQVVGTAYGGNPSDIPNEDSASFEFDETNLFSYNKFPGLDRWEEGPRINAGVRMAAHTLSGGSASVVFGQSYRFRDDPTFDPQSGLERERSDYVGRIDLRPGRYLDLIHRFRLDRNDLSFRRNEVSLWAGTEDYNVEIGYVRLADDQIASTLGPREEITGRTYLTLSDNWAFQAGARRDLEDSEMIQSFAGLIYEDECTEIELSYRRRFTRDRDIEPSTAVMLRVRLTSLGN
jgi:LPS-assembly protein